LQGIQGERGHLLRRERKEGSEPQGHIVFGDNLACLRTLRGGSIDLVYIDPPFNPGRVQSRNQLRTVRHDRSPDRMGLKANGYRTRVLGAKAFDDLDEDVTGFIVPRLEEAHRVPKPDGPPLLHIDYREVHYCKGSSDGISSWWTKDRRHRGHEASFGILPP